MTTNIEERLAAAESDIGCLRWMVAFLLAAGLVGGLVLLAIAEHA